MIELLEGTGGSGKTYWAVVRGLEEQRRRYGVVANFPITKPRRWDYQPDITPAYLINRARAWIEDAREGQVYVILDEAERYFNPRTWNEKGKAELRLAWIELFSMHRHLGMDFLLTAPTELMIDKQIRPLIEKRRMFRALRRRYWWLPVPVHISVEKWTVPGLKNKIDFFTVSKRIRGRYDHLAMRRIHFGMGAAIMAQGERVGSAERKPAPAVPEPEPRPIPLLERVAARQGGL